MPCFALRRGAGGPGAVGVAFAAPKELFGDRPRALNPTLLTSRGIRDIGAAWEEKPAARVSAAAVAGKAVGLLSSGASAAAAGAVAGDRAPLGRREAMLCFALCQEAKASKCGGFVAPYGVPSDDPDKEVEEIPVSVADGLAGLRPSLLTSRPCLPPPGGAQQEGGKAEREAAAAAAGKPGARSAAEGRSCRRLPGRTSTHPTPRTSRSNSDLRAIQEETPEEVRANTEKTDEPADFASSAARGRRCKLLSERTCERMEAEYVVDASSGQLVVKTVGSVGEGTATLACPIVAIEDIYTVDDGAACFPGHVMELLTAAEVAGLCLIVWTTGDPDAPPEEVYLVEASRSARDSFLQHLLRCLKPSSASI